MIPHPALEPSLLAAVAAVAREGSFERAAQSLAITPSALSQRVKLLEERLGAVLLVRSQPARATPIGQRLVQHAEALGLLQQALLDELHSSLRVPGATGLAPQAPQDAPRLRLVVNADSLATWFVPALSRYAAQQVVQFELTVDDQDHTAEWLRRGEAVAAVTGSATPVPGCRSHALGRLRYVATASPDFVQRWFAGRIRSAAAWSMAPMLVFDAKDQLQHRYVQSLTRRTLQPPMHRLPSTPAFVQAALSGLGWGLNPLSLVQDHLTAGRLVEIVPGRPVDVPLHWQVTRLALPQARLLTDCVLAVARAGLLPPSRAPGQRGLKGD